MTVYYILIAAIFGLAYPLCIRKPSYKKNIIYTSIIFVFLFFIAVLRYGIGSDYFQYRWILREINRGDMSLIQDMMTYRLEPAYILLNKLTGLLGGEYLILNFLIAVLIYLPAAYVIIKESPMPWISCWLYLAITFFYNSMNFTRQTIAVSIIFLAWHFMKEKKHWAVILLIIAGSLFHFSTFILIPIYFLSFIKPSPVYYGGVAAAAVLTFIFSEKIIDFVINNILTFYSRYNNTIYIGIGLEKIYIIIPTIIFAFMLITYISGWKNTSENAAMLTSFSFFNVLIWLFIIKHFILERFSMPVYVFSLIGIPEALSYWKDFRVADAKPKGKHFKNSTTVQEDSRFRSFVRYSTRNGRTIFPFFTAVIIISTFTYNDFCMRQRVHGVFPYSSVFDSQTEVTKDVMREKNIALFPSRTFHEFLSILVKGNYTAIIAVKNDSGKEIDFITGMMLKRLGVTQNLNELDGRSYVGIFENGKAIEEIVSDDVINERYALADSSVQVNVISGGRRSGDPQGLIIVNGQNFSPNTAGLNFGVIDNDMKKLIASQTYNTADPDYPRTNTDAFYGIVLDDYKYDE